MLLEFRYSEKAKKKKEISLVVLTLPSNFKTEVGDFFKYDLLTISEL